MIQRITDKIWLVEGLKGGCYPYSHSLYINDGGGVLVDCGSDPDEIERLRREQGLAVILMTHYHEDHFYFLHRFPDLEVWATGEDAPPLESLETLLDQSGAAGTPMEDNYRRVLLGKFHFVPRKIARRIADREELHFGGIRARALVAPGHTPGHLCLHFPQEGILFLGDYDLTPFGPWYGDRVADIDDFKRSGRMLAELNAEINVVSHEDAVHRGSIREKMERYLAVIDRREEKLMAFLAQPRSMDEIIAHRVVYGEEALGEWFDGGEFLLMGKHLERMIAQGRAAQEGNRYFLTGS
jgi:glyoxylase-like metal-dependent hydrolase (beta-lactamase superfamily II)